MQVVGDKFQIPSEKGLIKAPFLASVSFSVNPPSFILFRFQAAGKSPAALPVRYHQKILRSLRGFILLELHAPEGWFGADTSGGEPIPINARHWNEDRNQMAASASSWTGN